MEESDISINQSTRTMDSNLAGQGILTQEQSLLAGSVQGH